MPNKNAKKRKQDKKKRHLDIRKWERQQKIKRREFLKQLRRDSENTQRKFMVKLDNQIHKEHKGGNMLWVR